MLVFGMRISDSKSYIKNSEENPVVLEVFATLSLLSAMVNNEVRLGSRNWARTFLVLEGKWDF